MTEKKANSIADMFKDTSCYTYEVTMVVQVLAPTKELADAKLEQEGGYVSKRSVVFKDSTLLYKDGLDIKALLQKDGKGGKGGASAEKDEDYI
jgi:hypothetical protein